MKGIKCLCTCACILPNMSLSADGALVPPSLSKVAEKGFTHPISSWERHGVRMEMGIRAPLSGPKRESSFDTHRFGLVCCWVPSPNEPLEPHLRDPVGPA